ncbi:MAG: ROK family protein [Clostridia bacterium]|nr:ROK family protein [Clostridia bacterium]
MIEYIGVDIGGTNIRVGYIDENEKMYLVHKESTLENVLTSEDLYNKIKELIKKVPHYEEAKAIGIGIPGAIKNLKEIMTSRNLPLLLNFPLVERLEAEFNKKVYIENDAKVATLAEAVKGAGKKSEIVCYVTISTGLGGGIAINKHIYYGANGVGGYFSRMILDGENMSEHVISGTSLINKVQDKGLENITCAAEIFESSNNIAVEIVKEFKRNLTNLLLNISITINPHVVVLGGGVMKSKKYFLEDVNSMFKEKVHSFAKDMEIKVAELEEPGVLGAALIAKDMNNK